MPVVYIYTCCVFVCVCVCVCLCVCVCACDVHFASLCTRHGPSFHHPCRSPSMCARLFNLHCISVGLARTLYIYTLHDRIFGVFPCPKYRIYTVYIRFWPALPTQLVLDHFDAPDKHFESPLLCVCTASMCCLSVIHSLCN